VFSPSNSGLIFFRLLTLLIWCPPSGWHLLQIGGGSPRRSCIKILGRGLIRWSFMQHGSSGNIVTLAFFMGLRQVFRLLSRLSRMRPICG
jgi:hypothetical protein